MSWSLLLASHVAAACLALPIGAVALLRRRKGDRFHKMVGYTWAGLMVYVAVTSFWIRELNDGAFSWIHGLSVLTLVTLALGILFARLHNRRAHLANMVGTYLGLWGAFAGAVAVPERAVPSLVREHTLLATGLAVGLALAAALVLHLLHRASRRRPAGSLPQ